VDVDVVSGEVIFVNLFRNGLPPSASYDRAGFVLAGSDIPSIISVAPKCLAWGMVIHFVVIEGREGKGEVKKETEIITFIFYA